MTKCLKKESRTLISVNKNILNDRHRQGILIGVAFTKLIDNCNICYIDSTGRNYKERLTEHKNSVTKNCNSTGFSKHCINWNHTPNGNKFNIFDDTQTGRRLEFLKHT